MQREEGIAHQQAKNRDCARTHGNQIPPNLEFADEAVSGTKRHRHGLDAMLRAAAAGEFQAVYFFSLSRLARESVISMPILKELVYVHKVRVISVTEGIDSERDGWELIASILSLQHERYTKELGQNVFRGQEGTVLAGFAVGDHCFGYTTEPIPGSETSRSGRSPKPRKRYVVDPATAAWVTRIFHWFVVEERSLTWIARELNRRGAPKDHRATTKAWRHQYLTSLLSREKYIGIWPWGRMKNVRNPATGAIIPEERPEEQTAAWTRHFPELQIISDELFQAAQRRLEQNREKYAGSRRANGTLRWHQSGSADRPPQQLLQKLIQCGACGATFWMGGTNNRYLFCPNYRSGECPCRTKLQRARAERLILDAIGQRILTSPAWRQAVLDATSAAWERKERELPSELRQIESRLAELEQIVGRLLDSIENGLDDPTVNERLMMRREERNQLTKRLAELRAQEERRLPAPTEAWIDAQLAQLGTVLRAGDPAAAHALRELVGGSIVVHEIRQQGRRRHSLQGTFSLSVGRIVNRWTGNEPVGETDSDELREEIVIDFVDPNPLNERSERAKELYDQGLLGIDIAAALGCKRSVVTKLLKHWFTSRGLEMPDGRSRRHQLPRKSAKTPRHEAIADQVKQLADAGWLLQDIALELRCDRNQVTKALAYWYTSRDLPVPDGRTRRKGLDQKVSSPRERHSPIEDVDGDAAAA